MRNILVTTLVVAELALNTPALAATCSTNGLPSGIAAILNANGVCYKDHNGATWDADKNSGNGRTTYVDQQGPNATAYVANTAAGGWVAVSQSGNSSVTVVTSSVR